MDIYFTVDPIDGTKALERKQSHGIGTMISLVCNGEVIGAFVGDVMTSEIYGFRPESEKVHRISDFQMARQLGIQKDLNLESQYALLFDHPASYSASVRAFTAPIGGGGLFKSIEVSGGRIGVAVARLWKGEIEAVVLRGAVQTPWDMCPIVGISNKLRFRFLKLEGYT